MKLFGLQYDIIWEDKAANFEKIENLISQHADLPKGALLVLPEMYSSGFSMHPDRTRDSAKRESETFLSGLAERFGIWILGGLVPPSNSRQAENQAVAFNPDGRVVARYQKIHPFTLGGEAHVYPAGDKVVTFNIGDFLVCPFICYDLRFPEIFRVAASQRADLLVVIANWPDARISHWVTLLQSRAIENQAYVIGVNRCGKDPALKYSGRSIIVDPSGVILTDAGDRECCIHADLDFNLVKKLRKQLPFQDDLKYIPPVEVKRNYLSD